MKISFVTWSFKPDSIDEKEVCYCMLHSDGPIEAHLTPTMKLLGQAEPLIDTTPVNEDELKLLQTSLALHEAHDTGNLEQ